MSQISSTNVNDKQQRKKSNLWRQATRPLRAVGSAAVFFLKIFPMLPSRPVDWVTPKPVVERVRYPTRDGYADGDVYRPASGGPHPGILICLGVVPFEVDHPQVPIMGRALARAGFAALMYWSPAMRDFRLDMEDIENIPLAYQWLIEQPNVDASRSGLLGTCVGGSFAFMSAASPLIRSNVSFVTAYAPFSSMWTLARDIASRSREGATGREPWKVDQLTQKVFVHSLTAMLPPEEAERLRRAFAAAGESFDGKPLSADGEAVYQLLTAPTVEEADEALRRLPEAMREHLDAISPKNYIKDFQPLLFTWLHDHGDQVIPVIESRRLQAMLAGRPGVHYTEMGFSHLDPVKGKLPFFRLVRELGRFFKAIYPVFYQVVG